MASGSVLDPVEPGDQVCHPHALGAHLRFVDLRGAEDGVDEVGADPRRELAGEVGGEREMLVGGEAEAQPELGIVFEEGVRPGRAAPGGVVVHGVVGRLPP